MFPVEHPENDHSEMNVPKMEHPESPRQRQIDSPQLLRRKAKILKGRHVVIHLRYLASSHQSTSNPRIAQHPGHRHLRQSLPPPPSYLIQTPYLSQRLVIDASLLKKKIPSRPRVPRNPREVPIRKQSLRQRTKHDAPNSFLSKHIKQSPLRLPHQHRILRLMNQARRPQSPKNLHSLQSLLRVVSRNPSIERPPRPDSSVQRPHRLLHRRLRIRTVMIKDVDILKSHALKALIEASQKIFS